MGTLLYKHLYIRINTALVAAFLAVIILSQESLADDTESGDDGSEDVDYAHSQEIKTQL